MKTLLCLFALVLLCSQAASLSHTGKDKLPGGWKTRDPQEFMKDSHNQEILEKAKEQFVYRASELYEISCTKLTVKDVTGIATQVVSGMNIRFDVDLVDSNGKVYDVTLVVWSQPWKNSVRLTDYTIN